VACQEIVKQTVLRMACEPSLRTNYGVVLTLLWWKNEKMLIAIEEYEEKRANRRSDGRREDED
jgi:hypothetical protein